MVKTPPPSAPARRARTSSTLLVVVAGVILLLGGAWLGQNARARHQSKLRDVPLAEREALLPLLTAAHVTESAGVTYLIGRVDESAWRALGDDDKRDAARQLRDAMEGTGVASARVFAGHTVAIAVRGERYLYH